MDRWMGCEIIRLDAVDSTNRFARRWAREGGPHGGVVVAREQTAGRGRRGHTWASAPDAGLWLSILLRPQLPPDSFPLLPLAAGLATADACRKSAEVEVAIKWPNDIILKGRKITGILVEREGGAAVMGIGINVRQRPEDFPLELRDTAGSLEMLTGRQVSLPDMEAALLDAVFDRMEHFDFMDEYNRRCATTGREVRVILADRSFTGRAEGIDATGALLVRRADGAMERVLAGDVSVRGLEGYV